MKKTIKQILVVDDDPDWAEILAEVLLSVDPDLEIRSAENATEGIEAVRRGSDTGGFMPDLIIADYNMPGMDGYEMIQAIFGLGAAPLVIINSGNENPAIRKMLSSDARLVFLPKPCSTAQLWRTINTLAERRAVNGPCTTGKTG